MDTSIRSTTAADNQAAAHQAASSLQLLLREDPALINLTEQVSSPDTVAFPYAASLLESTEGNSPQQQAANALQDVERKLALVESLAVKLSRTSPEAVSGHLLQLHGYSNSISTTGGNTSTGNSDAGGTSSMDSSAHGSSTHVTTLASIRERATRLEKQSESLENAAKRVETVLTKGLDKMQIATNKLERVLSISSALKMILRLQFETAKVLNYDLDDLRDLTRAAASVSVLEDLLIRQPSLSKQSIAIVERMRPVAEETARAVRYAANQILHEGHQTTSIQQLGAVLQIYYHLGELPNAVWDAVDRALADAENITQQLWSPATYQNMLDQARNYKKKDNRSFQKRLKDVREAACREWADGVTSAAQQVRNLHRVLARKTDPVQRTLFVDVVAEAPIPPQYPKLGNKESFSLFGIFWARYCQVLSDILESTLQQSSDEDVAALYPAVRAVALEMVGLLQDSTLSNVVAVEEAGTTVAGVLGGSSALNDPFLELNLEADNPQAAADNWTHVSDIMTDRSMNKSQRRSQRFIQTSSTVSAVLNSQEWKTLQKVGLRKLEDSFLTACSERLTSPLQYMFPENVNVEDDGVAMASGHSLLPSKYDVQRFDENIRQELSLADPREGGGDMTLVSMIASCVVSMISEFCVSAKRAMSGVGEQGYVNESDWSMTEALQHDRKVVAIMYTLKNYLKNSPEKTFIAPYRPAVLPQHTDAANLCTDALEPACNALDNTVKTSVLLPLCRALNRQICTILAKIPSGVYLETNQTDSEGEENGPSFVQKELTQVFDAIAEQHLSKFPPAYAAIIASNVTAYSIYAFLTYSSLVRPLGENARLHITQDLADLEMALSQLISKSGGSMTLNHVEDGKPYAELRAVRQMLFWSGLDNKNKTADEVAKSLLREVWVKDIRCSTLFHYLFSFGPNLLSSPQHVKRITVAEYGKSLIQPDGSITSGEDSAWMTIMSCCDSYQQRASAGGNVQSDASSGDTRIAQIVLILGQELLRRRGRN